MDIEAGLGTCCVRLMVVRTVTFEARASWRHLSRGSSGLPFAGLCHGRRVHGPYTGPTGGLGSELAMIAVVDASEDPGNTYLE